MLAALQVSLPPRVGLGNQQNNFHVRHKNFLRCFLMDMDTETDMDMETIMDMETVKDMDPD